MDDVAELERVPVILIDDAGEPGADDADKKRVKTEAGKRFVPVHPELERIGFLAFAEEMRGRGEKRLFPELKPDSLGYLSGPFSKWFNDKRRFLGKLEMEVKGVSFHSFRHKRDTGMRGVASQIVANVAVLKLSPLYQIGANPCYSFALQKRALAPDKYLIKNTFRPQLGMSHPFRQFSNLRGHAWFSGLSNPLMQHRILC
ncbi:hypothetical protein [Methylorubrum extorquens]|uniref:hypothetical protein n=1 Tax=Methylorubrum extorquens TaxID=408 RepID=UPI0011BE406D|nr:hypothetical protein [Methylorubrum extorquens]